MTYTSKMYAVENLMNELLAKHGLSDLGWTFKFNARKKAKGVCKYSPKRIELSHWFVINRSMDGIESTIMHEICHALVGPGFNHGPVWKRKMVELGQTPSRVSIMTEAERVEIPHKYVVCHKITGKIYLKYHRRMKATKIAALSTSYMPSDPTETYGKLVFLSVSEYNCKFNHLNQR